MSDKITIEIDKDDAKEVAHLIRWSLCTQPTTGAISPKLYAIASKLDPRDFTDYDYLLYSTLYDEALKTPYTEAQRKQIIDGFIERMERD